MEDKLLEKYTSRVRSGLNFDAQMSENSEPEDLGCFGWLRGVRDRAIMLELRKKDGHIMAIGYSWLERVEFEPDRGIMLVAAGKKIIIKGSGLNSETRPTVRLFDGILRHRVPWIREVDLTESLKSVGDEIVIETIEWND